MHKRVISFTTPQNDWLEAESERLGISAAELCRRAVDWFRGEIPRVDSASSEDKRIEDTSEA